MVAESDGVSKSLVSALLALLHGGFSCRTQGDMSKQMQAWCGSEATQHGGLPPAVS